MHCSVYSCIETQFTPPDYLQIHFKWIKQEKIVHMAQLFGGKLQELPVHVPDFLSVNSIQLITSESSS